MSKHIDKPNALPAQGQTPREAKNSGKTVGQSKRKYFAVKVVKGFILAFTTAGIVALIAVDTKLLAGTMGETLWNEFGEGGLAVYVPLALVIIAAFAHRLVSKQSDEELKTSWLGRLVKRLCIAMVLSIAALFSITMLKSLSPALPTSTQTGDGWGQGVSNVVENIVEAKAAAFAAFISPLTDTIFAAISGGILIITAFLLMIMMDWWYQALKTLIVGRSLHNTLMEYYEYLKTLRARYIRVAATVNSEAKKTITDRQIEFALYIVTQGLKAQSKQRSRLSDRKLKQRIKKPTWQEMDEHALSDDPSVILKQRKAFGRALNIDSILNIIQRDYS